MPVRSALLERLPAPGQGVRLQRPAPGGGRAHWREEQEPRGADRRAPAPLLDNIQPDKAEDAPT